MSERLTFDTVIATRNRPEALALSIPLILGQSRHRQFRRPSCGEIGGGEGREGLAWGGHLAASKKQVNSWMLQDQGVSKT
jgi:hypothetical protein